jgi:hypothetical protein
MVISFSAGFSYSVLMWPRFAVHQVLTHASVAMPVFPAQGLQYKTCTILPLILKARSTHQVLTHASVAMPVFPAYILYRIVFMCLLHPFFFWGPTTFSLSEE